MTMVDRSSSIRVLVKRSFTLQPIEIAAIASAGLAFLITLIALFVCFIRRSRRRDPNSAESAITSHSSFHSRSHSQSRSHSRPQTRSKSENHQVDIRPGLSNLYLLKNSHSNSSVQSAHTNPSSSSSRLTPTSNNHSPNLNSRKAGEGSGGSSTSPVNILSARSGDTTLVDTPSSSGGRRMLKKNSPTSAGGAISANGGSTSSPVQSGRGESDWDRPTSVVMITYEEGLRRMGIEPPSFSPNQPTSSDGRVHPLQTEYDMPDRRRLRNETSSNSNSQMETQNIPDSPPPRFTLATATGSSLTTSSPRLNVGRSNLQRSGTNGSGPLQSTWLPSYYRLTSQESQEESVLSVPSIPISSNDSEVSRGAPMSRWARI